VCTQVVIDAGETLWQRKDPDGILALTRLLEAGFLRLAETDPALCATRLPRAFHALTPQVEHPAAVLPWRLCTCCMRRSPHQPAFPPAPCIPLKGWRASH